MVSLSVINADMHEDCKQVSNLRKGVRVGVQAHSEHRCWGKDVVNQCLESGVHTCSLKRVRMTSQDAFRKMLRVPPQPPTRFQKREGGPGYSVV